MDDGVPDLEAECALIRGPVEKATDLDRDEPAPTCGTLCNRDALQRCGWAFCEFCRRGYPPLRIRTWCDPDTGGHCQTAVCPACGVAAVVGYAREVRPRGATDLPG